CPSMFSTLFFSYSGSHRDLHSFPTRRSSDLIANLLRPRHLADVDQSFHAFLELDECAVVGQRDHAAVYLRAERVTHGDVRPRVGDRKSTRLNSSHLGISYAVFCLKKKKKTKT